MVLQKSGAFLHGVPRFSELAEAHVKGHHHHKSQDGGPGCQFPVATRKKGKEDLAASYDPVWADDSNHNKVFYQPWQH